jgi:Domain of Unknown Function (DUF748)
MKHIKKIAIIAAGILILYALFGFFALPRLLKPKLVEAISAYTGRPVALGEISTNPFALSATLRNLVLTDRNEERLLAFEALYINFEVSSLFRGGYAFSEIRLRTPYLRFLNRADGSSNFQDVMPATDTSNATPADTTRKPVTVFIDHLLIDHAELVYEDRQRATPFVARIDSLNLSLRDFATKPQEEGVYQFAATTDKGEGLKWRGNISVIPFRSAGNLALTGFQARTIWEYIQDSFDFEITAGLADFQADYEMDFSVEPGVFNLRNGSGALQNLTIVDRRDSTAAVAIPTLTIRGLEAEINKSILRLGEIESRAGKLFGAYLADSTLSLSTLFLPKPAPLAPDTAASWQVTIGKITLEDYAFHFENRMTTPFAQLEFTPLHLTMTNFVYGVPGQAAQLDVAMHMKSGGRIKVQGTYIPEPAETSLEVQVDSLALRSFQPYVNSMGKIELKSGTLALAGHYHDKLRGEQTFMDFKGEVRVEALRAVDLILNQDFLRWGRLDLKRLDYRQDPPSVTINEIVARRPYIRMIIGSDRVTNIQHIFGVDSLAAADSTQQDSAQATPTRIGQVRIIDGSTNFSDLSLTPNFVVGIEEMNGTIKGLSSEELDSAEVDLNGKVDKYAPVTITGLINPLTANAFTDITMKFQSIELTTFTPYSGKFFGYKIDKGKLNLDLHYVLAGRTLNSENHIVFDQLTLGEKVDSPDATSLPLKLAIGLLKDSHGVIDLDIPVKGSLDDPKFSIMPIVWKALLNLLIKAVTSPFKLLGALFGGGDEDLEYVSFSPGADSLATSQQAKLDSLAKALTARPGLKLDIRGAAALAVDRERLAVKAITAQIRPEGNGLDLTQMTRVERERLLKLYTATFNDDPNLLTPEKNEAGEKIPRAEREAAIIDAAFRQLVAQYQVSESELRALAQNRAAAIKDRLVIKGGIEELRVFLQDVEIKDAAEDGEIRIMLALDAR